MHPVDACLAAVRAKALHALPEADADLRKRVDELARKHFPGLIDLAHRGQAEAFTAGSLGVTQAARDAVLLTAGNLQAAFREGEGRLDVLASQGRPADAAALDVLRRLVLHLSERWRLEREVGAEFQRLATEAADSVGALLSNYA